MAQEVETVGGRRFDDHARSRRHRRCRLPAKQAFYEQALAPLGLKLLIEFSEAAAGFGRDNGERPSFFREAHGEPARGRLHIALGAQSRAEVDAFHAAAIAAGGTDNGAPGVRWYHADYYGAYVLDHDGNNIESVCHEPA